MFSYLTAPCGAGKTYAMIHEIYLNLSKFNHLIVVPSHIIQRQWQKDLIEIGVPANAITVVSCNDFCNDDESDSVPSRIQRALKSAPLSGQILIITHVAYNLLPYLPRSPWRIIIDEVPETQWFYELSVSVDALKQLCVELDWPPNPNLVVLKMKAKTNIQRRIKGVEKTGDMGLVKLLQDISDKRRIVFVSKNQWNEHKKNKTIGFLAVYNFGSPPHHKIHHNIKLLAANFENSFAYQIAKTQGVPIKNSKTFYELRSTKERLLTIEYHIEDREVSKNLLKMKSLSGNSVKEDILRSVAYDWEGQDYLYVLNKDTPDQETGTRLQYSEIKGVNSKTNYDRLFFGAAYNLRPNHYNLLLMLGIDRNTANRAICLEMTYQAVMRTSLRDPESRNPVAIRVPSKEQAKFLQETIGFGEIRKAKKMLAEKNRDPLPKRRYESAINTWISCLDNLPTVETRMTKKQSRVWQNEMWRIMCGLARAGLPHSDIRTVCLEAVFNNRELCKHVDYEMPRLSKWCSKQPGMPTSQGLEAW